MLLVEPGGETKVGQLDVTLPVDQDVVGFDVTASVTISLDQSDCFVKRPPAAVHAPMNKAQLVNGLDRQDTLGHVKLGDVFRERVVLDQPARFPFVE